MSPCQLSHCDLHPGSSGNFPDSKEHFFPEIKISEEVWKLAANVAFFTSWNQSLEAQRILVLVIRLNYNMWLFIMETYISVPKIERKETSWGIIIIKRNMFEITVLHFKSCRYPVDLVFFKSSFLWCWLTPLDLSTVRTEFGPGLWEDIGLQWKKQRLEMRDGNRK